MPQTPNEKLDAVVPGNQTHTPMDSPFVLFGLAEHLKDTPDDMRSFAVTGRASMEAALQVGAKLKLLECDGPVLRFSSQRRIAATERWADRLRSTPGLDVRCLVLRTYQEHVTGSRPPPGRLWRYPRNDGDGVLCFLKRLTRPNAAAAADDDDDDDDDDAVKVSGIASLAVEDCDYCEAAFWRCVGALSDLHDVSVEFTTVGYIDEDVPDTFASLSRLDHLTRIDFTKAYLDAPRLAVLAGLRGLRSLRLDDGASEVDAETTAATCVGFSRLTQLRQLELVSMPPGAVASVATALTALTRLCLADTTCPDLSALTALRELTLDGVQWQEDYDALPLGHIALMSHLVTLRLRDIPELDDVLALAGMTTLTSLDMTGSVSMPLARLAPGLAPLTRLRHLGIARPRARSPSYGPFDDFTDLADAIGRMTCLQTLDLAGNDMVAEDATGVLLPALQRIGASLERVDMRRCIYSGSDVVAGPPTSESNDVAAALLAALPRVIVLL
jgi:hypothetical protein